MAALSRRQLLAGASAAAVSIALPAVDFPALPENVHWWPGLGGEKPAWLGNPVRIMQRFLEVQGFPIDLESFDALAAHCDQRVMAQTNSTTPPDDIGEYLKALLI